MNLWYLLIYSFYVDSGDVLEVSSCWKRNIFYVMQV